MIQKYEDFNLNEGESADARFKLHMESIKKNMKTIQEELVKFEKEQSSSPTNQHNWGFAGSAEKINEDLVEILEFMGAKGKKAPPRKN
jgi:hypothetical protein